MMFTHTSLEEDFLPDFDFSLLSEAVIREEVIAPVLRRLGYRSGTVNTVIREKAIEYRYPCMFLGRKKPGKDPVLRGRPDYICEARNITRWPIEAKPPTDDIQRHDVEQAHSYAAHPELAAPLFVLCNGREWQIFESYRGPASEPLLKLTHEQLRSQFHLLHNLLSPAALDRRFPVQVLDHGQPLTSHHGSRAAIVGGFTRYDQIECLIEESPIGASAQANENLQKLIGYQTAITGGSVHRDENLGIVADIFMHFPHDSMRDLAEAMGTDRNRYVTRAQAISETANSPTIFECTNDGLLPAGRPVFDLTRMTFVTSPLPVHVVWYAEAIGHLDHQVLRGTYATRMLVELQGGPITIRQWIFLRGTFAIELRS